VITQLRNAGRLGLTAAAAVAVMAAVLFRLSLAGAPSTQSGAAGPGGSATPVSAIGSDAGHCDALHVTEERVTPAQELSVARNVVTATVVDVDSTSHWATPTDTRPDVKYASQAWATIYTIVHVRVSGVARGSATTGQTLAVRVQGGTIPSALNGGAGCMKVDYSGAGTIAPGSSVVLFLGHVPALAQATVGADFDVTDSWVVDDQMVNAPDGTSRTLASFLAQADGN